MPSDHGDGVGEDANGLARAVSKLRTSCSVRIVSVSLRSESDVSFDVFEAGERVRSRARIWSGRRWDVYEEGEPLSWEEPAPTLTAAIVRSYVRRLFGISFPETIEALADAERRVAFQARYITDEERLRRRLAGSPPKRMVDSPPSHGAFGEDGQ
jgi:hypothetical protein